MKAPEYLTERARAEWDRLVACGVRVDGQAVTVLAGYCLNFARWVDAEQVLSEHGTEIVIRDDKGNVKSVIPSPQIGISNKAFDRMLKAASILDIKANVSQSSSVAPAVRGASGAKPSGWFAGVN